jgi:hypothetical protein
MTLPVPTRDLLSDEALHGGADARLGAWDVRVLVEEGCSGGDQRGGETP